VETVDLLEFVALDPESSTPPFQQVREQIAGAIESGVLQPDARLPPVRRLATDLGLAANTVARSYRELELTGLVETRGRHGTFVAGAPSPARKLAAREARKFARTMGELGIGHEEALAILGRELDGLRGTRPRRTPRRKPGR
jgi:DNA-binding transcriptional regulator YhcF (GntR family)